MVRPAWEREAMTVSLIVQPLQWEALPELHETPDLDDSDAACMADIRAVLERHGKLDRFALHLIHRHFDLAPGEVLIERPDPDARTQHVSVGRLDDEPLARPTTWILGPGLRCAMVAPATRPLRRRAPASAARHPITPGMDCKVRCRYSTSVLIIHGRGLNSKDQVPVLKTRLAQWLARGSWARLVLAFTSARPCDGGAGALYVLLRRQRHTGQRPPVRVTHGAKW